MIIHRMELENWGPFSERRELEFSRGLNVVYGPNESGKSTVMQGVSTALFTRAATGAGPIMSLLAGPHDTTRKGQLVLEFSLRGQRYRVEKRFVGGSGTTVLAELADSGAATSTQTGETAQARLNELFGTEQQGAGRNTSWRGLWNLVWVAQGEQRIQPRAKTDFDTARGALTPILSRQVEEAISGDTVRALLDALAGPYDEFFTPGRGDEKKSGRLADAREACRRAEAVHEERLAKRLQAEEWIDRAGALQSEVEGLDEDRQRASRRHEQNDHRLKLAREAITAVQEHGARVTTAGFEVEKARSARAARAQLKVDATAAAKRVEDLRGPAEDGAGKVQAAEAAEQAQRERTTQLKTVAEQAAADEAVARKLARWHNAIVERQHTAAERPTIESQVARRAQVAAELATAQEAVVQAEAKAQAARTSVDEARKDLQPLAAYTAAALKQLQRAVQAEATASASWAAAQSLLHVSALKPLTLEVDGEPITVGQGERFEWPIEPGKVVRVPDVLELSIETRHGDLGNLDQARQDARSAVTEALAKLGVQTVDEAEECGERRQQAEAAVQAAVDAEASAQTSLKLAQGTMENLSQQLRALPDDALAVHEAAVAARQQRVDEEAQGVPEALRTEWEARSAAELRAHVAQVEQADKEATRAYEAARTQSEKANNAVREAEKDAAAARSALQSAEDQLATREAALASARAAQTDDDVDVAADAAQRAEQSQRAEWQQACQNAAARGGWDAPSLSLTPAAVDDLFRQEIRKLVQIVEDEQRAAKRAEEQFSARTTELTGLRAQLDVSDLGDLEAKLGEAEAHLGSARTTLLRLEREAQGVKLLRDTVLKHQKALTEAVQGPLLREVKSLLEQFMPDAQVTIDDDLCINTVERNDTVLDVDNLSAGAREQFNVVLRLAMARLMAKEQPMLMLLDDCFESTDPERFQGMAGLLADTAEQMQVIVFTWEHERFGAVPRVHKISLTDSKAASA